MLKHGFAPKEQYTRHGRQGAFTDVYTVGASFYFAITGRRPPDSIDRIDEDDLIPPSSLGIKIAPEKEDAILKAMSVQPVNRYQTMVDFRKALMRAGATGTQPSVWPQAQPGMPQAQAAISQPAATVQQRVFTAPQPTPVQQPQSAGGQESPTDVGVTMPLQEEAKTLAETNEKKKRKYIVVIEAIFFAILVAVAIMISTASSDGNAKKDAVHYEPGTDPVIASNTTTEPVLEPGATPASEFRYWVVGGMITISGYDGEGASVVIPSKIEGNL